MAITQQWLSDNSNSQSYSRGQSISNNQHIEIKKNNNVYTATVYGSDAYEVEINDNFESPQSYCSCPYDWGGLCKHIIAVALEILEENFEEITPAVVIENKEFQHLIDDTDFYKNIFKKAETQQQQAFLRQLFEKNRNLRAQFVQFLKAKEPPQSTTDIFQIRDKVNATFSELDLDLSNYYEREHYDHWDYYDEGEGGEQWAQEQIEKTFKPYFQIVRAQLEQGNLLAATAALLGIFEGINYVESPIFNDDFGYPFEPDEYEDQLRFYYKNCLSEIISIFNNNIYTEATMFSALDLIFSRHEFYTENPESRSYPMVYSFDVFEGLFLAFLNSKKNANYLLEILEKHELDKSFDLRNVVLKIATLLENNQLWKKTAQRFASEDSEIALQLLAYFFDNQEVSDFLKTARKAFDEYPSQLSPFLLEKMKPDDDPKFYVKVLSWHTLQHRSVAHFEELRTLISKEEVQAFIASINSWNLTFLVQVLEIEKAYRKIFLIARQNSSHQNFANLVCPVISIFPEKCFRLITQKQEKILAKQRGRDVYQVIAKELELLLSEASLVADTKQFANKLVTTYPRLRALKEELKWKKLI